MGVVGPLKVHGEYHDGEYFVPLATTEGALVASINRGCAALREAGGAACGRGHRHDAGAGVPDHGHRETRAFLAWVRAHEEEIRKVAEGTSRYLRLLDIRPFAFGTTVFLRFRIESGDAMGMNMATIACDRVVSDLIVPRTGVRCIALSGNYCVDKKPAAINFQEGRGKRIHAEAVLDAKVLPSPEDRRPLPGRSAVPQKPAGLDRRRLARLQRPLWPTWWRPFSSPPARTLPTWSGSSMGITCVEERENGAVFASVFLPDVPLGAVGGGTALDTQREALALLGARRTPSGPAPR